MGVILVQRELIEEYERRGWWGRENILDLLYARAEQRPEMEALVDPYNKADLVGLEPRRMTYREIIRDVDRLALSLMESGLGKDDVVLVQLPNTAELVITLFAVARAGGIPSPLPMQWRTHEIRHALALTEATMMVVPREFHGFSHLEMARELKADFPGLGRLIVVGEGAPEYALRFQDLLEGGDVSGEERKRLEERRPDANEVFTICWTSGTEADPKAVPRSHNHWLAISRAAVESFLPDEECVYLSLFPAINMAGLGAVLVPWVITGGKMVLHHPFDLMVFLQQLVKERVYYTLAPPALLDALAKSPQWAEMDKGDLKVIGSGSAPLSEWMVAKFQNEFGIGIVNFFASNEGVALYSSPKDIPDPHERARYFPRFGVEGISWKAKAVEGFRTRLVDPETEKVIEEKGVVGELRFAGPTVFSGYYRQPELTEKAFDKDGYYRSGDLFSIEGENMDRYRFHGRYKDLIIRGGVNISPEEIETLVVEHPKVAEVAAVGYPDERLGERVCIVVVPVQGEEVTLEEINAFLAEKDIAKYKYPEKLIVVESLPRNPLNKVIKSKIREMIREQAEEG